jgi:signal peptidase I
MNMLITILLLPFIFSICAAFCYKFYEGAGYKKSDAFIPYYNLYILSKIIRWNKWWCYVLLIFPYINTFMAFLMFIELANCYNRFSFGEIVAAGFFPYIYFPILSRKDEKYHDPKTTVRPPKGWVRDWLDSILWAVFAALIIRTFMFEMYTIPSSSMEGTLMTGDYLLVSKIGYGPRFPNTPITFPFVHHTLPWTKYTKSYIEWPQLGYWRLPGFTSIKRNDPIVFNFPAGDTVSEAFQSNVTYYQLVRQYGRERVNNDRQNFGRIITRPVDKRENYVKRLIALPGDTLQIIDGIVYINGEMGYQPPHMQHRYLVKITGNSLNPKVLERFNIYDGYRTNVPNEFILCMSATTAEEFGKQPFVTEVTKMISPANTEISQEIFPNDTLHFRWNVDNYGPIVIPKEGVTVKISPENIALYERCITAYEHNTLNIKDNKFFINGKETDEYTFGMDYYWMMGDNRHNSQDSRFWGYVPVDHIVGKPLFVWFSKDNTYHKIRWNRFFKFPK